MLPVVSAAQQMLPIGDNSPSINETTTDRRPRHSMIIDMRTGETHLDPSPTRAEGQIARWLSLQAVSISSRYHFIDDSRGVTVANNNQYQVSLKGTLHLVEKDKLSIKTGVFSGNNFNGGWNASGWGSGDGQSNLFLKQLYLSAKPAHGVEVQFGSLYFEYGESTEITSYDFDGYLTGERLKLTRPHQLFFDEVSVTFGYVGDLNQPGVNKRWRRLKQSNYHQFLVAKHLGKRASISGDYSFESGIDTFRQAIKVQTAGLRIMDTLHFENYQRTGFASGYGFGVYGEKKLSNRFSLGGGFARIDRSGLNSDRFARGRRIHLNSHITLNPEMSLTVSFTQAIANDQPTLPSTRLDVAINYNLLETLKKTGLF